MVYYIFLKIVCIPVGQMPPAACQAAGDGFHIHDAIPVGVAIAFQLPLQSLFITCTQFQVLYAAHKCKAELFQTLIYYGKDITP